MSQPGTPPACVPHHSFTARQAAVGEWLRQQSSIELSAVDTARSGTWGPRRPSAGRSAGSAAGSAGGAAPPLLAALRGIGRGAGSPRQPLSSGRNDPPQPLAAMRSVSQVTSLPDFGGTLAGSGAPTPPLAASTVGVSHKALLTPDALSVGSRPYSPGVLARRRAQSSVGFAQQPQQQQPARPKHVRYRSRSACDLLLHDLHGEDESSGKEPQSRQGSMCPLASPGTPQHSVMGHHSFALLHGLGAGGSKAGTPLLPPLEASFAQALRDSPCSPARPQLCRSAAAEAAAAPAAAASPSEPGADRTSGARPSPLMALAARPAPSPTAARRPAMQQPSPAPLDLASPRGPGSGAADQIQGAAFGSFLHTEGDASLQSPLQRSDLHPLPNPNHVNRAAAAAATSSPDTAPTLAPSPEHGSPRAGGGTNGSREAPRAAADLALSPAPGPPAAAASPAPPGEHRRGSGVQQQRPLRRPLLSPQGRGSQRQRRPQLLDLDGQPRPGAAAPAAAPAEQAGGSGAEAAAGLAAAPMAGDLPRRSLSCPAVAGPRPAKARVPPPPLRMPSARSQSSALVQQPSSCSLLLFAPERDSTFRSADVPRPAASIHAAGTRSASQQSAPAASPAEPRAQEPPSIRLTAARGSSARLRSASGASSQRAVRCPGESVRPRSASAVSSFRGARSPTRRSASAAPGAAPVARRSVSVQTEPPPRRGRPGSAGCRPARPATGPSPVEAELCSAEGTPAERMRAAVERELLAMQSARRRLAAPAHAAAPRPAARRRRAAPPPAPPPPVLQTPPPPPPSAAAWEGLERRARLAAEGRALRRAWGRWRLRAAEREARRIFAAASAACAAIAPLAAGAAPAAESVGDEESASSPESDGEWAAAGPLAVPRLSWRSGGDEAGAAGWGWGGGDAGAEGRLAAELGELDAALSSKRALLAAREAAAERAAEAWRLEAAAAAALSEAVAQSEPGASVEESSDTWSSEPPPAGRREEPPAPEPGQKMLPPPAPDPPAAAPPLTPQVCAAPAPAQEVANGGSAAGGPGRPGLRRCASARSSSLGILTVSSVASHAARPRRQRSRGAPSAAGPAPPTAPDSGAPSAAGSGARQRPAPLGGCPTAPPAGRPGAAAAGGTGLAEEVTDPARFAVLAAELARGVIAADGPVRAQRIWMLRPPEEAAQRHAALPGEKRLLYWAAPCLPALQHAAAGGAALRAAAGAEVGDDLRFAPVASAALCPADGRLSVLLCSVAMKRARPAGRPRPACCWLVADPEAVLPRVAAELCVERPAVVLGEGLDSVTPSSNRAAAGASTPPRAQRRSPAAALEVACPEHPELNGRFRCTVREGGAGRWRWESEGGAVLQSDPEGGWLLSASACDAAAGRGAGASAGRHRGRSPEEMGAWRCADDGEWRPSATTVTAAAEVKGAE
eukprot:TRINITY_DN5560_c0_g1_i3.p1 TRINITY_DN5560_c0_g1~~TRINITY_DN5560_c0_g1_i3.p1  ORF type:complete len:1419 (+),score=281.28 TRINITY_DN5560_c0_g1_i3:83-4339(+)